MTKETENYIIKPQVQYVNLGEFEKKIGRIKDNMLDYINKYDELSHFEPIDRKTIRSNPSLIHSLDLNLCPNLYHGAEKQLGLIQIMGLAFHRDKLLKESLLDERFEEEGIDDTFVITDKSAISPDLTRYNLFNGFGEMQRRLIAHQDQTNSLINRIYQNLGLSNAKEETIELNLGKVNYEL